MANGSEDRLFELAQRIPGRAEESASVANVAGDIAYMQAVMGRLEADFFENPHSYTSEQIQKYSLLTQQLFGRNFGGIDVQGRTPEQAIHADAGFAFAPLTSPRRDFTSVLDVMMNSAAASSTPGISQMASFAKRNEGLLPGLAHGVSFGLFPGDINQLVQDRPDLARNVATGSGVGTGLAVLLGALKAGSVARNPKQALSKASTFLKKLFGRGTEAAAAGAAAAGAAARGLRVAEGLRQAGAAAGRSASRTAQAARAAAPAAAAGAAAGAAAAAAAARGAAVASGLASSVASKKNIKALNSLLSGHIKNASLSASQKSSALKHITRSSKLSEAQKTALVNELAGKTPAQQKSIINQITSDLRSGKAPRISRDRIIFNEIQVAPTVTARTAPVDDFLDDLDDLEFTGSLNVPDIP